MRACAGLLALLLVTSACSGGDSPRRERRHRDRGTGEASSREADIRTVVTASGEVEAGRQDVHETIGDFSDLLQQVAPPEARRGVRQVFDDADDEIARVDFEGMAVRAYARHLSDDDARALRAFYETPAGRRIAAAYGDIHSDLKDDAERAGEEIGARIAARIQNGEYSGVGEQRAESRRERRRRLRGEE